MTIRLEVCVADADGLAAAIAGGADRIELCAALELGGLTPTPGLMALAAEAPVPVYAMIRPRSGDFVYSPADRAAMLRDLAAVRAAGLCGVVLGASRPDGRLDAGLLEELSAAAEGLGRSLHRAFDLVPALEPAVETAVALGFERILTSGRARRAIDGAGDLRRTIALAAGRIGVMAGAGLGPDTVGALLASTPVDEIHGSCSRPASETGGGLAADFGFVDGSRRRTDAGEVRRMKRAIAAAEAAGRVSRDGDRSG